MLKIIITIVLASVDLFSQNVLSIPNVSGDANSTITAEVVIDNNDPFVAFQCDIQLNDEINYVNATIALTGRASDHVITAQLLSGNILRILSYSLSQTVFSGNSGAVCTFDLSLGNVPGDYPLTISNPIIGASGGSNILTGFNNGQITIFKGCINGSVIYNTVTSKFNFCENGIWVEK